jgi:hypothetical protein
MTPHPEASPSSYVPRDTSQTVLCCDTCQHEMLLAFSCKRRGFCPSYAGRRMAQAVFYKEQRVRL